jgi:leucyl/phenylalanyl-tRNA---protein transferase
MTALTDLILDAYRQGVFPMAESAEDEDFAFYRPHVRALIPMDLHIPSKLLKTIRKQPYNVTIDRAFGQIIEGCAAATSDKRANTWINKPIRDIFIMLQEQGHAHSVECWDKDGNLAGGLYGLSIGAVFCGESMVSFQTNASKIALVHLCAVLKACGYTLIDSQFMNPHLLQFGAYEMPQEEYVDLIKTEMNRVVADVKRQDIHLCLEKYLRERMLRDGGDRLLQI